MMEQFKWKERAWKQFFESWMLPWMNLDKRRMKFVSLFFKAWKLIQRPSGLVALIKGNVFTEVQILRDLSIVKCCGMVDGPLLFTICIREMPMNHSHKLRSTLYCVNAEKKNPPNFRFFLLSPLKGAGTLSPLWTTKCSWLAEMADF